jgi:hypothetical protein
MDNRAAERPSAIQTEMRANSNAGERVVARSFYNELRERGYSPKELLAVSIELIDLVTRDLPKTQ